MSLLEIPGNQIDKMQPSTAKHPVFQCLRGLSSRRSPNNANRNKEDFYSQDFRHLLSFFNISYYTLVTPFAIAKSKDGLYKIHTSILQQICVAILNTLAVTVLIRQELNDFRGSVVQKPEQLFRNVKAVSRILTLLICIYIFWTKRSKIKKLLKSSQNGGNKEQIPRMFLTSITVILLGMWIFDNGLCAWNDWQWKVTDHAHDINKLFYFGNYSAYGNKNASLSVEWKLLGSLYYFLTLYAFYIEEICQLLIFTLAFTVYRNCNGFYSLLHSKTQDITKVSLHYRYVRKITDLINDFVGPFLPVYILGVLNYLLTNTVKMENRSSNPYAHYLYYGYLAKNVTTLIIAAEANRKMHYLEKWLFQFKMEEVYDRRMNTTESEARVKDESYRILSSETSARQIGLGCHLFTITYSFTLILLGIFATYTIVQMEFHKNYNCEVIQELNRRATN